MSKSFQDRCCNPFEKPKHKKSGSLRRVTSTQMQVLQNLDKTSMLCVTCRQDIYAMAKRSNQSLPEEAVPSTQIILPIRRMLCIII